MLKRQFRLSRRVKPTLPHSLQTPFLKILYGENNLGKNRFSVVVSKQIDKRAVVRNRLKRMLRDCLVEISPLLKPGFDVVVIAKKQAINQQKSSVYDTLYGEFKKRGYL